MERRTYKKSVVILGVALAITLCSLIVMSTLYFALEIGLRNLEIRVQNLEADHEQLATRIETLEADYRQLRTDLDQLRADYEQSRALIETLREYFFFQEPLPKAHTPLVAFYPFEIDGHQPDAHWAQFLADTWLIRELRFEGVKMFNIEYYYNTRILENVTQRFHELELKVVPAFLVFDITQGISSHTPYNMSWFPENQTKLDSFCDYMSNVASKLKNCTNILYYAIHYPWDWRAPEFRTKINTAEYKQACQRLVDAIRKEDPHHDIYMISEGIERSGVMPPLDLNDINGFGVEPYPEIIDDLGNRGIHNITWTLELYRSKTDKPIVIDEWGLRTESYTGETYGMVSSEAKKVELIAEFVDYIYTQEIVWCYFGLHDHWSGDFGLAESDNIPKLSGEKTQEMLKELNNNPWSLYIYSTCDPSKVAEQSYVRYTNGCAHGFYNVTDEECWAGAQFLQGQLPHGWRSGGSILGGTSFENAKPVDGVTFYRQFPIPEDKFFFNAKVKVLQRNYTTFGDNERAYANIAPQFTFAYDDKNYDDPDKWNCVAINVEVHLSNAWWNKETKTLTHTNNSKWIFECPWDGDHHICIVVDKIIELNKWYTFKVDMKDVIDTVFNFTAAEKITFKAIIIGNDGCNSYSEAMYEYAYMSVED